MSKVSNDAKLTELLRRFRLTHPFPTQLAKHPHLRQLTPAGLPLAIYHPLHVRLLRALDLRWVENLAPEYPVAVGLLWQLIRQRQSLEELRKQTPQMAGPQVA